jgi:hypothetical protein
MGRDASDKGGGGDFTPAPAGTHVARCVRLIDLGTHHGEWQGTPTVRNQVYIGWELPNELDSFNDKMQPYVVGMFATNSLNEKSKLRPLLEAWRGRAFSVEELMKFDLVNILGQPCLLTVVHEVKDGKTKAKVLGAGKLVKGMECPPQVNPSQQFWIDEFDPAVFESLPEGFQRIIKESDEYKQRMMPKKPAVDDNYPDEAQRQPDPDDDIPF